jgi:hypothetical protein
MAYVGEDGVGVEVVLVVLHVGPTAGEGADGREAVNGHRLLTELAVVVAVELGEEHVVAVLERLDTPPRVAPDRVELDAVRAPG